MTTADKMQKTVRPLWIYWDLVISCLQYARGLWNVPSLGKLDKEWSRKAVKA